MAVLWRSMEHGGQIDDGFQNDTLELKGGMLDRNSFFEKHVRISETMPSDTQMKTEVKRVWGDRRKSDGAAVEGGRGTRSKHAVYGSLKPAGSSIVFLTHAAFAETNAWIEKFVTKSGGETRVPLLGGATVVSWSMDTFVYEVVDAGYLVLGIRVGKSAWVELGDSPYASDQDIKGTMQSRVVYHFNPPVRG